MRLYRLTSQLGWPTVVVVCALPVLRWATVQPLGTRFDSPVVSLLSIGEMAGLIGLMLYAINLILATRLRIFEDLFGGLNKVFIAHHIIGTVALLALLVHPLMLSLRLVPGSVREAALLLIPHWDNLPVAYGIFAMVGLVGLLILTYFVALPYRIWLFTHKFLGAFFFLAGLHVLLTPNDLSADPVLKTYMLGFVGLGLAGAVYRTLLPQIFMRRYAYTVQMAKHLNESTVQVDMVPVKRAMNFRPGQFLFVSFRAPGVSREWHPFTISSVPGDQSLSITVKSLGTYTGNMIRVLSGMSGVPAWVEGAYGRFSFRNFGNMNQIWVAGGIGITPFLSMAHDLGDTQCNIDLYYSVKAEAELIDLEKLREWVTDRPGQRLRVFPFVADKQKGFLTAELIQRTSGELKGKEILLCGPPPMMKSLKDQLAKLGVDRKHLHSEEFSLS